MGKKAGRKSISRKLRFQLKDKREWNELRNVSEALRRSSEWLPIVTLSSRGAEPEEIMRPLAERRDELTKVLFSKGDSSLERQSLRIDMGRPHPKEYLLHDALKLRRKGLQLRGTALPTCTLIFRESDPRQLEHRRSTISETWQIDCEHGEFHFNIDLKAGANSSQGTYYEDYVNGVELLYTFPKPPFDARLSWEVFVSGGIEMESSGPLPAAGAIHCVWLPGVAGQYAPLDVLVYGNMGKVTGYADWDSTDATLLGTFDVPKGKEASLIVAFFAKIEATAFAMGTGAGTPVRHDALVQTQGIFVARTADQLVDGQCSYLMVPS